MGFVFYLLSKKPKGGLESSLGQETHLPVDSRNLLRPFRETHAELTKLVQLNQDVPTIAALGQEAIGQSQEIYNHALKLAETRSKLKETVRGRTQAQLEMGRLQERLRMASTDVERQGLESAIDSVKSEIEEYGKLEDKVKGIDGRLAEAHAAMAELKSKMVIGAAGARARTLDEQEFQEMFNRLKSLDATFQETEQWLEEKT